MSTKNTTSLSPSSVPRVLTIAGSDSGGSAGIQADLKTYEAHQVFGTSALTVVTAQNTQQVYQAFPLPENIIEAQIRVVLADIGATVVKTGLLGRESVIRLVADLLREYGIMQVVVDPVMVDGRGKQFVSSEAMRLYQTTLFPLATVITPNLDEATLLTGLSITSRDDLFEVARRLHSFGVDYVLLKGGHLAAENTILDLLYDGEEFIELVAPRLPIENPHGVGCTLASAVAAELAKGNNAVDAVKTAHQYLQDALRGSLSRQIGTGRQPVYHAVGNTIK